ncbi:ribosome biogenesis protein BRX1 homolog [Oscarella lobularis]|uniref:ribosome biogenesis protein BRX1 homolog n=1 Tax=Oscarella lobularis TaxID=121494 RepID=UPI0033141515
MDEKGAKKVKRACINACISQSLVISAALYRRSSGKDEADKDEQGAKKPRWTNKQRVLIFCARGITHRPRHLMNDLRLLLPHSKADAKLHGKDKLFVVNEVCDDANRSERDFVAVARPIRTQLARTCSAGKKSCLLRRPELERSLSECSKACNCLVPSWWNGAEFSSGCGTTSDLRRATI